VRGWAEGVVGAGRVTDDLEADRASGTICVYPLEVRAAPEARGLERAPIRYLLRSLVLVSPDADGLSALDALLLSAADSEVLQLDLSPIAAELWSALGIRPRPAFVVEAEVVLARSLPAAPLVREPLVIHGGLTRTLRGRLVGPGGRGLGDARVELADSGAATRTASDGSFSFHAVSAEHGPKRFTIDAKGGRYVAVVDVEGPEDDVLIHCNPLEA
jgi:hypothetical protein